MQTSLFPTRSAAVTQTAGIDRNNIALTTFSHQENRANDICPTDGKFYAPFDMHCVMHELSLIHILEELQRTGRNKSRER